MESSKQRFYEVVRSLEKYGFLDYNFRLAQSVKKFESSFTFLELIANFRADSQSALQILMQELDQPIISFSNMDRFCFKLKGSASSIDIPHMALACSDLKRAIDNNSREECASALNRVRLEFLAMQDKLDLLCQLERRVVTLQLEMAWRMDYWCIMQGCIKGSQNLCLLWER